MTKTRTKTQQSASSINTTFAPAFDGVDAKIELPEATRDFVRSQAAAASERANHMHQQAASVAEQAKVIYGPFAGSYERITRSVLDATLDNTKQYLTAVEKLADANSVSEALSIQADFVQKAASSYMERFLGAADQAKTLMADNVKVVQDQAKKAAA